jgi:Leucine-rich repeat (LRR) protein
MENSRNNKKLASFFTKTYKINSQELQNLIDLTCKLLETLRINKSSNHEDFTTNSIVARELDISNCNINNGMLKNFCKTYINVLPFFTSLILDNNNISELPEGFYSANRHVSKLSIAHNHLTKLPNLQELPKLASLDISNNEIEGTISIPAKHCLENLQASSNRLTAFEVYGENNNLTLADLRKNDKLKIYEIDVLLYPNNLTVLCDETAKGENVNNYCSKDCESGMIKFNYTKLPSEKEVPKNHITLLEALKAPESSFMKY